MMPHSPPGTCAEVGALSSVQSRSLSEAQGQGSRHRFGDRVVLEDRALAWPGAFLLPFCAMKSWLTMNNHW